MNFALYIMSGFVGVANMVLWGVYGDLLIENFSLPKAFRSIFLGFIYSIYLYWVDSRLPLLLVLLIVIALERVTTEIYKALIRDERQVKYKIPSDLGIDFPRSVEKLVGYLLIGMILISVKYVDINFNLVAIFLIGIVAPAVGGMMKDAPYEGFYPFKFLRSPLVVLIFGLFLFKFFGEYEQKYLLIALWGGERVISEWYKKILNGRIPGKFKRDKHHHINYFWKSERNIVLIPYYLSIIFMIVIGLNSLLGY